MIKKLVTLLSLAALAVGVGSTQADAAPCTPGLASAYEALGAAGCQIGDKTFSEFNFTSTEVLDSQIIITPGANILTAGDLGFRLTINGLVALGANRLDGSAPAVSRRSGRSQLPDLGCSPGFYWWS